LNETVRTIDMQQLRRYKTGGYRLFPLHQYDFIAKLPGGILERKGKSPRDKGWQNLAYPVEELKDWIRRGGNIGVHLREGDLVVDFDPRTVAESDKPGRDIVLELELELGIDLSQFPCVRTGSGGYHWYMRMPEGVRVRNEIKGFEGIEFKAYNKYVVAAGCIHPGDKKTGEHAGQHYTWVNDIQEAGQIPPALLERIAKAPRPEVSGVIGEISNEQLKECLDQLDPKSFRSHDMWLELMMASHSATGGNGLAEFQAWSTGDPKYAADAEIIAYRWDSCDPEEPEGYRLGTLYMHVLEAGGQLPRPPIETVFEPFAPTIDATGRELMKPRLTRYENGQPKPTVANGQQALLAMECALHYDTFRTRAMMEDTYWLEQVYPSARSEVDALTFSMLQGFFIDRFGLELSPGRISEAVDTVALKRQINPLAQWLDTLTWDGIPRLDNWLTLYAGVEDNPYTRAVARATILGATARAYEPGIKFDTMLILEGPQGTFKSTIVRILGGDFYMAGLPNKDMGDKDIISALAGKWIVEIEELSTMRRTDAEAFKGFLSKQTDTGRMPYKPASQDYPRRCIFIGTTNPNGSGYLSDSTGNRRFFPVTVGIADTKALERDRDQLFAQAAFAWKADPRFEALLIPEALWSVAADEQDMRRTQDPWEAVFGDYLAKLDETVMKISSQELWFGAMTKSAGTATLADFQRMGIAVAKSGWVPEKNVPTNEGYKRGYRRAGGRGNHAAVVARAAELERE
jgi:predicted P-loop ATPase